MKKAVAVDFFGTQSNLAKVLTVSQAAISRWGETVPEGAAYKLESLTGGQLKVDPALYVKETKPQKAN